MKLQYALVERSDLLGDAMQTAPEALRGLPQPTALQILLPFATLRQDMAGPLPSGLPLWSLLTECSRHSRATSRCKALGETVRRL